MPRTTVYIRNDDYEKWKLIENKSELISEAINKSVITSGKNDNYLEHHVIHPQQTELGAILSSVQPKIEDHTPSNDDLVRMIKELDFRINVLAESQAPEDQDLATNLFDQRVGLQKILAGRQAK